MLTYCSVSRKSKPCLKRHFEPRLIHHLTMPKEHVPLPSIHHPVEFKLVFMCSFPDLASRGSRPDSLGGKFTWNVLLWRLLRHQVQLHCQLEAANYDLLLAGTEIELIHMTDKWHVYLNF